MGGRGASSGGRRGRAPQGYRTVGKSHGILIIKSSVPGGKILPTTAKPNSRYLGMNRKGIVKQLRIYDKNGNVKKILIGDTLLMGTPKKLFIVISGKMKNGKNPILL